MRDCSARCIYMQLHYIRTLCVWIHKVPTVVPTCALMEGSTLTMMGQIQEYSNTIVRYTYVAMYLEILKAGTFS